jgi:hypothetical protein
LRLPAVPPGLAFAPETSRSSILVDQIIRGYLTVLKPLKPSSEYSLKSLQETLPSPNLLVKDSHKSKHTIRELATSRVQLE